MVKFYINKKGAMFGLDARIALAIFGALSVISGAALYSAIQDAKATSFITDLQEIGKAWEAYYLDTGSDLPLRSSDSSSWRHYSYNVSGLVDDKGIAGWKGPYLPYPVSTNTELIEHPVYKYITIEKITNADWSATQWIDAKCDTAGDACFLWVSISGYDNISLAQAVDKKIDDGDGAGTGNFRWVPTNPTFRYSLKYTSIKNPHD